jgi:hypothetical protein
MAYNRVSHVMFFQYYADTCKKQESKSIFIL